MNTQPAQPVMTHPTPSMQRFFVRHSSSGEVYAVETVQYETVLETVGPLPHVEVRPDLLDQYEYSPEDADWFNAMWGNDDVWTGPLMSDDPIFG